MSDIGPMPKGWASTTIREYTRIRTGKLDANAQVDGGQYPFFTCGDEVLHIDNFAFDSEAVLLAGNGNFNVKWYKGKFNAYQRTYVIEPICVVGKFLYYQLIYLLPQITKGNRGSTIRFIRIGDITNCVSAVPPLGEQSRLVQEIERHLSRLDAAVAALRRVQANLKRYRAAVLKAACEGRLVPTEAELARREGRSYEPASVLLGRILAERRFRWQAGYSARFPDAVEQPKKADWRAKYEEPEPPDTKGLPQLPDGWVWTTAEQLSDETRAITYGVIKLGEEVETGIPTLRSSDVRHLRLDLEGVKRVSPNIAQNYRRTFLRGGEVLVTVRGTLGGVVVVPHSCEGFNISREVAMIAPVDEEVGPIIAFFVGSTQVQNWLLRRTKGIAYTGINIETLKRLPIPLPPKSEQARLTAEIARRLSVIEEIEAQILTALTRAGKLRQSVLKNAFEGQLVPQDPKDEPANVLLERIRADRNASHKSAPTAPWGRQKKEAAHVS